MNCNYVEKETMRLKKQEKVRLKHNDFARKLVFYFDIYNMSSNTSIDINQIQ